MDGHEKVESLTQPMFVEHLLCTRVAKAMSKRNKSSRPPGGSYYLVNTPASSSWHLGSTSQLCQAMVQDDAARVTKLSVPKHSHLYNGDDNLTLQLRV